MACGDLRGAGSRRWLSVVGGAAVYWIASRAAPLRYATTAVTQGEVVTTITASGSVNPVVVVLVGTYVSGTIATLSCDYNTRVHKGQLCAKIDPKPYQMIVDQDKAELDVARAQLVKDRAHVVYTKTNHERLDLLFSEDSTSHDAADAVRNQGEVKADSVRNGADADGNSAN